MNRKSSRAAAAALLLSGCVIGQVSERGLRCWGIGRGEVSRTITRENGDAVTEVCKGAALSEPVVGAFVGFASGVRALVRGLLFGGGE